jgi:hypothetical protein
MSPAGQGPTPTTPEPTSVLPPKTDITGTPGDKCSLVQRSPAAPCGRGRRPRRPIPCPAGWTSRSSLSSARRRLVASARGSALATSSLAASFQTTGNGSVFIRTDKPRDNVEIGLETQIQAGEATSTAAEPCTTPSRRSRRSRTRTAGITWLSPPGGRTSPSS